MMAAPPAATGFTLPVIQRQATWLLGEKRPTRPGWVSILSGPGLGRLTGGLFTTVLLLTLTDSRAIHRGRLLKWDTVNKKWLGDIPDGPCSTDGH